jgi:hypothetical protein
MTTLILLTLHPGGLERDLDQNSNYSSKNDKSFDEHSSQQIVWKNLDSTKAMPTYCRHPSLEWVQQWVKKGWKLRLQ